MPLDADLRARLNRYLAPDLIDQLPATGALTATIRRLNSLSQALNAFVPQMVVEEHLARSGPYAGRRRGTFLFADVAGFTPLAGILTREAGAAGAEILTQIINDYFATMLEILAKSNGQLLKFAGDALLAFFPAAGNGAEDAAHALRAGLRMQRAMAARFQPVANPLLDQIAGAGDLHLTMSIGLSRGDLVEAVVGNAAQRDAILLGDLPDRAMRAEAAGQRDDVLVDDSLVAAGGEAFKLRPVADGIWRVQDTLGDDLGDYELAVPLRRRAQSGILFSYETDNLLEELHRQLDTLERVARFVAPEVVDRLAFRGGHIESEHRPATVLFVHMTGIAALLEAWDAARLPQVASILDRAYSLIQHTVAASGGSLTRSDPFAQGTKLLITFGAPVAHADDPERAISTALELNRQIALLNARLRDEWGDALPQPSVLTQRIGIAYGSVFAGEVGWQARREYTVMGDEVNLAARLMAWAKPGQIVIGARMWERAGASFATQPLPPLALPGRADPVQAYLVLPGATHDTPAPEVLALPLVGREEALRALRDGWAEVMQRGQPQVLALVGEPGVGKSRLAEEVAAHAARAGGTAAWLDVRLRPAGGDMLWASLIAQVLRLDEDSTREAQRRLLRARLEVLGVVDLEAVLAQCAFGLPSPPAREPGTTHEQSAPVPRLDQAGAEASDSVRSGIFALAGRRAEEAGGTLRASMWSAAARRTSLPAALARLLAAIGRQSPVLVVVDDVHRAAPDEIVALQQVIGALGAAQVMVLLTCEPGLLERAGYRLLTLVDLPRDAALDLAARVLNVQAVDPPLADLLWEQAGGRPLFVVALARQLAASGAIMREAGRAGLRRDRLPAAPPDDVRDLITGQLDRLPPESRALLRTAAVCGVVFTPAMLRAVGEDLPPDQIEALLADLVTAQVLERLDADTYRFRYGLARDVTYQSLPRLLRQKMHRRAAGSYLAQPEDERDLVAVAEHLSRGGLPMRAMELIFWAAGEAEQRGEIVRAVALYEHGLAIFPHDESIRAELARLRQAR